MQRLGQNRDGYYGERIDVDATLAGCRDAARRYGWTLDSLPPEELDRPAFVRRIGRPAAPKIYLSTGMHGDEPAGPCAALQLVQDNVWPDADLWLIPCLNPAGLRASSRTNAFGIDVNRDYRQPRSP